LLYKVKPFPDNYKQNLSKRVIEENNTLPEIMDKIGIFFGPLMGAVNRVSEKVKKVLGENAVLIPVKNATSADLKKFDKIIFGISTVGKDAWDSDSAPNDWEAFLPEISKVDFKGKKVAIFGLGNHLAYPQNFVDSMGMLAKELIKTNATIIGQVSTEGYEFKTSEAVIGGRFIGLPLDEDFESELTDGRLGRWITNIATEFGL
jgi:flavodoxin I